MIFSFLVFILGIIQYPRPSKLFWKITLIYCTIIIFLKFVFQLNVWNNFEEFQDLINIEKKPLGIFAILGIYKLGSYEFLTFFRYVFFDFLILIALYKKCNISYYLSKMLINRFLKKHKKMS